MQRLTPDDLLSLERYARERPQFRARVLEHKRNRQIAVGPNATWLFEDRLTVHYQVQEMLRTERIFESEGIAEELATYNPLIPDGGNWKVTLLIEFPDPEQRREALARLKGVEARCWARIGDFAPLYPIADEDLERENAEKTSAVHFLRFEIPPAQRAAVKQGAALAIGIDHPYYQHRCDPLPDPVRAALAADLD